MTTVTVSPEFQIVIPRAIRAALGLQPGQKMQAIQHQDRIELIPVRPMHTARGILSGIDSSVPRDDDRLGTGTSKG